MNKNVKTDWILIDTVKDKKTNATHLTYAKNIVGTGVRIKEVTIVKNEVPETFPAVKNNSVGIAVDLMEKHYAYKLSNGKYDIIPWKSKPQDAELIKVKGT